MKTGNSKKSEDTIKNGNSKKAIPNNIKKDNNIAVITLLPLLAMFVAILPGVIFDKDGIEIVKTGVLTLVLTTATTFYIKLNADIILDKKYAKTLITLAYLCSIGLLMLIPNPDTLCFWMIGGLLVAMLIDNKLGLLLHFNLTFVLGLSFSLRPETVILILIIGVLMSILANVLKQKNTVIYAIIIILSTNVTLAFVINNFILETDAAYNYLNSLFSISGVLLAAFFLSLFYEGKAKNGIQKESATDASVPTGTMYAEAKPDPASATNEAGKSKVNPTQERISAASLDSGTVMEDISSDRLSFTKHTAPQTEEEEPDNLKIIGLRTSYEVLCDPNNELLQKLKAYSENLYEHAVRIGDLSSRAAKEIGADELLSRAGGLYHEIGKIRSKNYIEEGLIIAEDYAFPKELKTILKEHNIKHEKPSSIEAAIVMLSDSVVSTIEYIEKTEEHKFTANKIIDNIFQMRLDKGTFDDANLSLKNFKILKEFYQNEFHK